MAISVICCINPSPPTPSSNTSCLPSSDLSRVWRSRAVSGVACMIIGSTVGYLDGDGSVQAENLRGVAEMDGKAIQWSKKRTCPQWHANSLESVVPENLPRPYSSRRRSEVVASINKIAPRVGVSAGKGSSCFSL